MFEINLTDAVSSKYKKPTASNAEASPSKVNSVFQDAKAKSTEKNSALSEQEKTKQAELKARAELCTDLDSKNNGKPVIPSLNGPFEAAVSKMHTIDDAFVGKVSKLLLELGNLDPESPEAESRTKAVEQEIKALKAEAKRELDNLSNVIFAMEEISEVLVLKHGKDKASNIPLGKIVEILNTMVASASTASPDEITSQVQKLLEDFKKEEDAKDKKQGNSKLPRFVVFSASLGSTSNKV